MRRVLPWPAASSFPQRHRPMSSPPARQATRHPMRRLSEVPVHREARGRALWPLLPTPPRQPCSRRCTLVGMTAPCRHLQITPRRRQWLRLRSTRPAPPPFHRRCHSNSRRGQHQPLLGWAWPLLSRLPPTPRLLPDHSRCSSSRQLLRSWQDRSGPPCHSVVRSCQARRPSPLPFRSRSKRRLRLRQPPVTVSLRSWWGCRTVTRRGAR